MEQKVPDPIPSDLLVDMFSRVPAKTIARFRCVSKFWASILRSPDFTELFLTKSSTRPRLFFTIEVSNELFVFSSPQPQNPVDSCSLVATRYNYFPKYFPSKICPPLCGLVLLYGLNGWRIRRVRVICNPLTGESITLPKVKATGIKESYLGYDPISKQFKVLCMTWSRYGRPNTHRVLTLGTGKRFWRTTMECKPHYARLGQICINGVLYYVAYFEDSYMIVCFDFRFEKFSFIKILDQEMLRVSQPRVFSNYKGKLCAHQYRHSQNREELVLWVLEDAGKHKWSKSICVLSSLCYEIRRKLYIVGITGAGDIVFTPYGYTSFDQSNPFYLVFYNMERNTFARVNFQGFEEFKHHSIHIRTFLDYVENMTLM